MRGDGCGHRGHLPTPDRVGLSLIAQGALALIVAALGCADAHAQARTPVRRDAGVARRDAGAPRPPAPPLLPPTHGRIDPRAAQQALGTRATEVRGCYERGVAHDATLRGEILVRLRVETGGRVSQTSLSGDDALRSVGRCIEDALRTVVFPSPDGGAATVTVPYVFRPGD